MDLDSTNQLHTPCHVLTVGALPPLARSTHDYHRKSHYLKAVISAAVPIRQKSGLNYSCLQSGRPRAPNHSLALQPYGQINFGNRFGAQWWNYRCHTWNAHFSDLKIKRRSWCFNTSSKYKLKFFGKLRDSWRILVWNHKQSTFLLSCWPHKDTRSPWTDPQSDCISV